MFWGLFYNLTTGISQAQRTKHISDIEMDSDHCCSDVLMVLLLPVTQTLKPPYFAKLLPSHSKI